MRSSHPAASFSSLSYPHGSLEGLLLHELTHVFAMRVTGGRIEPRWFQEGIAMVASGERDLQDRAMTAFGSDIPRRLLAERADGVPFEEAVQFVTGRSILEFERDFWAQQTAWWRWIPVMTSSSIVWVVIMLAAWAAFHKQRQRAAVKRQWEKEEEQP